MMTSALWHDVRPLACDLQRPHQARLSGGVDFIDNDPAAAVGQPWVALDPATNLRLSIGAAVVENGALLPDVELLIGVTAHTSRRRSLDVDRGRAVGRLQHRGTLAIGCRGISNDLRKTGLDSQRQGQQACGLGGSADMDQ